MEFSRKLPALFGRTKLRFYLTDFPLPLQKRNDCLQCLYLEIYMIVRLYLTNIIYPNKVAFIRIDIRTLPVATEIYIAAKQTDIHTNNFIKAKGSGIEGSKRKTSSAMRFCILPFGVFFFFVYIKFIEKIIICPQFLRVRICMFIC